MTLLDGQAYISLSSNDRQDGDGCVNSFCICMPQTIPHIFPNSASSTAISEIALQVVEVSMSGMLNLAPGSIFVFRKKTAIEQWTTERYMYDAAHCKTIDDLLQHLNAVLPEDTLRITWNRDRTRIRLHYFLNLIEKAESDVCVVLLSTTLASKLGFTVPNLTASPKAYSKFIIYPDNYSFDVDIACNVSDCMPDQLNCEVVVDTVLVPGSPAAVAAKVITERQRTENFMEVSRGNRDLTHSKDIEAKYEPSMGSGMTLMELHLRQANMKPKPSFVKSPHYVKHDDSAVVARLDLSQKNVDHIKPTDTIILKPNDPSGVICNLQDSKVLIQLKDASGTPVPFDSSGEINVLMRLHASL